MGTQTIKTPATSTARGALATATNGKKPIGNGPDGLAAAKAEATAYAERSFSGKMAQCDFFIDVIAMAGKTGAFAVGDMLELMQHWWAEDARVHHKAPPKYKDSSLTTKVKQASRYYTCGKLPGGLAALAVARKIAAEEPGRSWTMFDKMLTKSLDILKAKGEVTEKKLRAHLKEDPATLKAEMTAYGKGMIAKVVSLSKRGTADVSDADKGKDVWPPKILAAMKALGVDIKAHADKMADDE